MNKNHIASAVLAGLSLVAGAAHAAADPVVTTALTTMGTGFADNFGPVVTAFVLILVTVTAVKMAVSWFKKSAK